MMDQSSVLDVLCVLKATQALASGRAGILTKECLRRTAAAALQGCLDRLRLDHARFFGLDRWQLVYAMG